MDVQLCQVLSQSSRQMALLSFRWSERQTSFTRDNTDFTFKGLVIEDLDVAVLARTPFMEANNIAVRFAKREVLLGNGSTYTYGSQAPPSPPTTFAEPLFSMLLLLPTLFGLENSWKYSSQTILPLIQSMALSPAQMHLVYIISSPLSCGQNPASFPVFCGQFAYQTCQPNLERLSVTNTSARSPLSLNQKTSHRQVSLLLSVRYHPLMLVTPHPSR